VTGSHACGDHWGNPCSVEANAALLKYLEGVEGVDTSRLGFMGGGLGGALIWNSVLGPFAGKVKAVAVMQAVANLSAVVREQKFKGVMLEAYGVPEDTPDDEAIKRIIKYDPMRGLQALEKGTSLPRTIIYHGAKDVNIPPDTSAKMLAEALTKAGGDVTLELFDEVEHNTYAMGKPMEDRLRSFFSNL
jgi:acetyl esterase/lipase